MPEQTTSESLIQTGFDLAGLDADALTALTDHPKSPVIASWESSARLRGGAAGALAAALVGSHETTADLDAALGAVLQRYPDECAPLAELRRFKPTPKLQHKDVWTHTMKVVLNCSEPDLVLRFAALLHDVGKPKTRSYHPDRGVTFDGHEVVGARIAERFLVSLDCPSEVVGAVSLLVRRHLRPHQAPDFTDSGVRRYVFDATPQLVSRLNRLAEADVTSKHEYRREAVRRKTSELRQRIREVVEADTLAAVRPPIDGTQVARRLGIAPGPELGRYMRALHEKARVAFAEGRVFTEAEAWELVLSLGADL